MTSRPDSALSSATPTAPTRPLLTTVDGALALVNGGVKMLTAVETLATKACPPKLNTICPVLPELNVAAGVLVAL